MTSLLPVALAPGSEPVTSEPDLILARVRLRAQLRYEWLREIGGPPDVETVLAGGDSPDAEAQWLASEPRLEELRRQLMHIERELRDRSDSRLAAVESIFGLEPSESDLLQLCLATAMDPALDRVCAFLNGDSERAYVTEVLAARLFGHGRGAVWTAESPLFRWQLLTAIDVHPAAPRRLECDAPVLDWFLGRSTLDATLARVAWIFEPLEPLTCWPMSEAVDFLRKTAHAKNPSPARLVLEGAPGSGRKTFAAAVASVFRLPLLTIHADAVDDSEWPQIFLLAQRHAFLHRCALAWQGESLQRRLWTVTLPLFPVQFVIADFGEAIPAAHGVSERRLALPEPGMEERLKLWLSVANGKWPEEDVNRIAERYRAQPGDVVRVARQGVASAAEAGEALRAGARGRLGQLAEMLACPFSNADLVVAPHIREAIADFTYEASVRTEFWERPHNQRMFPNGRGLIGLFSGPPGTGKTMAAQVIAGELGLDLYRIDLSAMVSKWVGETSKNIDKVLRRAAAMDAVLLFDEADALFAKRSNEMRDAQDKFANTDASHLMVAIENYSGVVILATNLKGNIDPAFIRRIRYVVEFARPDAAQRLEIWTKVLCALVGNEAPERLHPALKLLAHSVETTGSQIKYGVLAAVFLAQRERADLNASHLLRGLNRELLKEGRALTERDRERIMTGAG